MNIDRKVLKHPIFKIISEVIDHQNISAYVIGGYVRDAILERESKDIDIVVIGDGIQVAKDVANVIGRKDINIFKNFGTAMLRYKGVEVEFVGARKESYNKNSRNPIVTSGTLKDDQERRDFTINALAICLNKDNLGQLLDPFNGINDLKHGILKTPLNPNITFSDDPLRMMRAIRFAAQLSFTIDELSLNAIRENKERLKIVSPERIMDEFNKIMQTKTPSIGISLLEQCGLLDIFFPELVALQGVEEVDKVKHKDNFYHTLAVLDNIAAKTDNLWLRWAALMHDIGKPRTKKYINGQGWTFYGHNHVGERMVAKIFNRLHLPQNEKMKYVQKLVSLHMRPIALVDEEITDSAIRRLLFDASDDINDLMTLAESDITSKNEDKVRRFLQNFKIVREKLKEVEEKDSIRNFQPPISGEEIMKTFGIPASKTIGDIKNSIKEAILDGVISNSYEEAYDFMIKEGEKIGLNSKAK